MRLSYLLLGPSAFALLAGAIGCGISLLCLGSSARVDVEAGRIGLVGATVLLFIGGMLLCAAFAMTEERGLVLPTFVRWILVAALMVLPTAFLYGPLAGFHHHIGFGPMPFFYMVWNAEDPAPGSFQIIKGYEVWFDPLVFLGLLVVWMMILYGAIHWVRPVREQQQLAR